MAAKASSAQKKRFRKHTICIVAPDGEDAGIGKLFVKRGFRRQFTIRGADIVVFGGRSPVHPYLYGEHSILDDSSLYTIFRDKREVFLFKDLPDHTRKIGLNRGALLLNILSGGRSWQKADGHEMTHRVKSNMEAYNKDNDDLMYVNSDHVQLMRTSEHALILAQSCEAHRKSTCKTSVVTADVEPELVYYWHTNTLCSQFNPVDDLPKSRDFFFKAVEDYLILQP